MSDKIKYSYAKNENGDIVNIEDAKKGEKYFCIGCGDEMIVRLGGVRVHHFSHKSNNNCNEETYLHKLAKRKIVDLFNSSDEFFIEYCVLKYEVCASSEICELENMNRCRDEVEDISYVPRRFDLKQFYDLAEEEKNIGDFVADVLITNSNNHQRLPILIEVCVTHSCSEQKISSGYKIIEIKIGSESDVVKLTNEIKSSYASFYSFKIDAEVVKSEFCVITSRFFLYSNGKSKLVDTYSNSKTNCRTQCKVEYNSVLEVEWVKDSIGINGRMAWLIGLSKAIELGYSISDCMLCKYSQFSFDNRPKPLVCLGYQKLHTARCPNRDYAKQCKFYKVDYARIEEANLCMKKYKVKVYR